MMLSPRRSRAFLLLPILLFLIIWYYRDFESISLQFHGSKVHLPQPWKSDDEPSVSLTTVGPPKEPNTQPTPTPTSVELLQSQMALTEPLVESTQTVGTVSTSPDLLTSPSDVLLMFKTGASTFWRRMPMHLTTTLKNDRIPNHVIFSDMQEKLSSSIESIDVLESVSKLIKKYDPPAYDSYLELQSPSHINTYREHARLPGDEPKDVKAGNTPGWLLDKYKFLPMLTHAQLYWPDLKWYIYIEDDTFIFWDNVLQWLSTLSPDDVPSYYGAISGEGNETFAQGGSGLVFSRSLMRSVFGGDNPPDLSQYGNYTSSSCCGDIVFGKVLRDYGIFVNKGEYGPISFRPEPPWKTGFDELLWCSPVFTFHHLHQRDLIQLAELERVQRESSMPSRPTIFRDVFTTLILPHLGNETRSGWDNFASQFILMVNSTSGFARGYRPVNTTAFTIAFKSHVTCKAACYSLNECLSWRYESRTATCALDTAIKLGRELDPLPTWAPSTEVVSGWMLNRLDERLLAETCDIVKSS